MQNINLTFPMRLSPLFKYIIKFVIIIAFYIGLYLLFKKHYDQLSDISFEDWSINYWLIGVAILLVFPNWLLESFKWKIAVSTIEKISFQRSVCGVMRGIAPSLFTPNRVGEAIGRPTVLKEGNRLSGAFATAYCGFSQMPTMLFLGALACMFFSIIDADINRTTVVTNKWWFILLGFICAILVAILYMVPKFIIPVAKKITSSAEKKLEFFCDYTVKQRIGLLVISAVRYFVYSFQNYLVIIALGVNLGFVEGMMSVFLIYALMSFVPRPALAELGVRCSVSVLVLQQYCEDYALLAVSSVILWVLNLLIPAAIGVMLYGMDKKNEKKL